MTHDKLALLKATDEIPMLTFTEGDEHSYFSIYFIQVFAFISSDHGFVSIPKLYIERSKIGRLHFLIKNTLTSRLKITDNDSYLTCCFYKLFNCLLQQLEPFWNLIIRHDHSLPLSGSPRCIVGRIEALASKFFRGFIGSFWCFILSLSLTVITFLLSEWIVLKEENLFLMNFKSKRVNSFLRKWWTEP